MQREAVRTGPADAAAVVDAGHRGCVENGEARQTASLGMFLLLPHAKSWTDLQVPLAVLPALRVLPYSFAAPSSTRARPGRASGQ